MIAQPAEARRGTATRLRGIVLPTLQGYETAWLGKDLFAALIMWTLVVPQALAYAQTAGMPPETGLYVAIGGMLGYALLGASRQMNVGPEATVGLLSATAIAPLAMGDSATFITLSASLAILAGVVCIGFALLRLGFLARLLSRPVLVGFLAGTGVTMILSQADRILGVDVESYDAWTLLGSMLKALPDANTTTVAIGVGVVAGVLALRRWAPRVPAYLAAIIVATAITAYFQLDVSKGVEVVGSIPAGLPAVAIPSASLSQVATLLAPALGIAFLIFADSGITARALARQTHMPLDQDGHMLGMGAAGIASGLLGGFAVNGSASRSFAILESGGRSQVTSFGGVALVMLTLLFLAPLFAMMPLAALGGIIIVVALGLIDIPELGRIGAYDRVDLALALACAAAVIWVGMLAGIIIIILLSLLDVARRASIPNRVVLERVPGTDSYRGMPPDRSEPADPGVIVYRFDAPLFFANVQVFVDDVLRLARAHPDREHVLVNAEAISNMDSTAAQSLGDMLDELQQAGVRLALARVHAVLRARLIDAGLLDRIGEDRIFLEVDDGVAALTGVA